MSKAEPVKDEDYPEAVERLFPRRLGLHRSGRADGMAYVRSLGRDDVWTYWSGEHRTRAAVAMVVRAPGKMGMLFHTPDGAASPTAITECIRAASGAAANKLSIIQSLERMDASEDQQAVHSAGYEHLADLEYMRLRVGAHLPAPALPDGASFRTHDEFTEDELAELIGRTYVGSLDCPMLCGLRDLHDVIESHKSSGVFTPRNWLILDVRGQGVGCVLVNASGANDAVEVVYLGTVPEHRRQGFARLMLLTAAKRAATGGASFVTLASDLRNTGAMKLYVGTGFRRTDSRRAYVFIPRKAQELVNC